MTISTVTSEALQLKLRQLLPSQQGFGTDLSASDTIIPVIDLTAAAEGSDVPQNLQTALAFGSQTAFNVLNTTLTLTTSAGFWRVTGNLLCFTGVAGTNSGLIALSDGITDKTVYEAGKTTSTTYSDMINTQFDLTIFVASGESIKITSGSTTNVIGSYRQLANSNGVLVNPVGFTPQ